MTEMLPDKGEWIEVELQKTTDKNSLETRQATALKKKHLPPSSFLRRQLNNYAYLARRAVIPPTPEATKATYYISDVVDEGELEEEYTCCPLTIAILLLTVVELSVTIYYFVTQGEKVPESPLEYDPNKRYQAWRFVSYMLVHASYEHIICNVVLQLVLGIPLEMVHRFWRVMAIYLTGVIAGSLATSICDPDAFLVGASGGAYALITAHLASIIMNFKEIKFFPIVQLIFLIFVMAADTSYALYLRYSGVSTKTAYVAHMAGALAGLLLGIVVLRNLRKHRWEAVIWWICLETVIALLTLMIVLNIAVPSHFLPAN